MRILHPRSKVQDTRISRNTMAFVRSVLCTFAAVEASTEPEFHLFGPHEGQIFRGLSWLARPKMPRSCKRLRVGRRAVLAEGREPVESPADLIVRKVGSIDGCFPKLRAPFW